MKVVRRSFVINNDRGLHARAAALLVSTVERYNATVVLAREGMTAECDSILSVLTLACPKDSEITVEASGEDAELVMEELGRLIEAGFGENGNEF